MVLTDKRSQVFISNYFLIFSALLLAAHGVILLAIVSFNSRADGFPAHPTALGVYGLTLLTTIIYWLSTAVFPEKVKWPRSVDDKYLLAVVIPVFVSLMLVAAMWMTPWLGGARFAPYDPGDADVVSFFNLVVLCVVCVLGINYRSRLLLIVGWAFQVSVYVVTHSILHWIRYPDAGFLTGILGIRPSTFLFILGGYFLAITILHKQKRRMRMPLDWQFATIVTNLFAGWMAFTILLQWPQNGTLLGWHSEVTKVPVYAWNWLYPFAQTLIIMAMLLPIFVSIAIYLKRRE